MLATVAADLTPGGGGLRAANAALGDSRGNFAYSEEQRDGLGSARSRGSLGSLRLFPQTPPKDLSAAVRPRPNQIQRSSYKDCLRHGHLPPVAGHRHISMCASPSNEVIIPNSVPRKLQIPMVGSSMAQQRPVGSGGPRSPGGERFGAAGGGGMTASPASRGPGFLSATNSSGGFAPFDLSLGNRPPGFDGARASTAPAWTSAFPDPNNDKPNLAQEQVAQRTMVKTKFLLAQYVDYTGMKKSPSQVPQAEMPKGLVLPALSEKKATEWRNKLALMVARFACRSDGTGTVF